jgi:hypothetical protein
MNSSSGIIAEPNRRFYEQRGDRLKIAIFKREVTDAKRTMQRLTDMFRSVSEIKVFKQNSICSQTSHCDMDAAAHALVTLIVERRTRLLCNSTALKQLSNHSRFRHKSPAPTPCKGANLDFVQFKLDSTRSRMHAGLLKAMLHAPLTAPPPSMHCALSCPLPPRPPPTAANSRSPFLAVAIWWTPSTAR